MLYYFYEWNHALLAPLRAAADATRLTYQNPLNPASRTAMGRAIAAGAELFERTTRIYAKPEFGLTETVVGHEHVGVRELVALDKPFCRLLHFERDLPKDRKPDPRFLIVAPLSGHHSTLLRGTVEALLPYADVYITDWKDARTVPVDEGKFDLDDYTQYVIDFLRFLGPDSHVLGVCQPSVPVLMAVAHMEKHGDDCYPATMTLMGGPIDTRVNPTAVNRLAEEKGIEWFRDNVVMTVPFPQPGFRRMVYPGFLQLTGFMSMNLDRHMAAHKDFFWHLVKDDGDSAEKHRSFYDEYNAVMDMTAEFYLQTVEEVFIKHSLPRGTMTFNGETIDLGAIRRVALLTVEGENDDISGVGQTEAAQELCTNIPEDMRVHYVQPKVGHYGVFNGSRFRSEIVPRIVDFALTHGTTHGTAGLPKSERPKSKAGRNYGAHAERKAKAQELGQGRAIGGETGIADPLMFAENPFVAGARMMRAFSDPAEEAFAKGLEAVGSSPRRGRKAASEKAGGEGKTPKAKAAKSASAPKAEAVATPAADSVEPKRETATEGQASLFPSASASTPASPSRPDEPAAKTPAKAATARTEADKPAETKSEAAKPATSVAEAKDAKPETARGDRKTGTDAESEQAKSSDQTSPKADASPAKASDESPKASASANAKAADGDKPAVEAKAEVETPKSEPAKDAEAKKEPVASEAASKTAASSDAEPKTAETKAAETKPESPKAETASPENASATAKPASKDEPKAQEPVSASPAAASANETPAKESEAKTPAAANQSQPVTATSQERRPADKPAAGNRRARRAAARRK
ncbi:polyhydroxyalkanoate depolymerase [Fulvimarina endophytica]|uniref:Polyhydroxyalkanoate depolymerase n=1 Tax=Fulvimarina endophytica TaxID=2293836 RepID=A0A371X1Q9_9HYPH|nr:polyhydroxyalkanoate depolymerase [Fulvimarina endophytica]